MVAGSNAITLDGKLVNLDGMGNRVASITFGPKKVILLVGMNKVAPDLESAMARVKHHAAPINNIRYGLAQLVNSAASMALRTSWRALLISTMVPAPWR